jgi:hypothetical protein
LEFLPYAQIRRTLIQHGVAEQIEGDRLRMALRGEEGDTGVRPAAVVFGSVNGGNGRCVEMKSERIGECAERLLHRAHVNDFVMVPVVKWRPILDLIAFDLAANEDWLEVDADASLHQHTREPLVMMAKNRGLVRAVLDSLQKNAEGPGCEVTIAALDLPFVLEWSAGGSLALHCPDCLAEGLVQFACGKK